MRHIWSHNSSQPPLYTHTHDAMRLKIHTGTAYTIFYRLRSEGIFGRGWGERGRDGKGYGMSFLYLRKFVNFCVHRGRGGCLPRTAYMDNVIVILFFPHQVLVLNNKIYIHSRYTFALGMKRTSFYYIFT